MEQVKILKEQVLHLQRQLRKDNVIVHGIERMDPDIAATKVIGLLDLDVAYVEAYWLGRKSYKVPLLIRLKSSSDQRLVRETARRVRPPGVFINADLCVEDRESLKKKRQQRVPDREIVPLSAQPSVACAEEKETSTATPLESTPTSVSSEPVAVESATPPAQTEPRISSEQKAVMREEIKRDRSESAGEIQIRGPLANEELN